LELIPGYNKGQFLFSDLLRLGRAGDRSDCQMGSRMGDGAEKTRQKATAHGIDAAAFGGCFG
jgi:hypothetical protein